METYRSLAIAVALTALVLPTVFTAPSTRSTCNPVCRPSSSKIKYEEGKIYTYGFETEVVTQVVGSSDEQSKVKVKGQVLLTPQSSCDFLLGVQDVGIQTPSGQTITNLDGLKGSYLRFSYQDGQIDSICTSENDPIWSVNVKRAIISMLVNTHEKAVDDEVYEDDITGHCPTKYAVSGDEYTKTRDLNSCSNRDGGATVFLGVPYTTPSRFNSLSIIDSALTCTQELKNGIFTHISCIESHKAPFLSTQRSGVQTEIKSSLNLIPNQAGVIRTSQAFTKSSSIFYDHSAKDETNGEKLDEVVQKLCQEVEDGKVSSKVPSLYLQVIKVLKSTKKSDIKEVYEGIQTGRVCEKGKEKLSKLLVDAAATSGSDGGIAFLAELIADDKVGCYAKTLFHNHASFSTHPGISALEGLQHLVGKGKVEYLLTASAVAHQYCKMINEDCGSSVPYRTLVDKIAHHVHVTHQDKEIRKVVGALQALGNLDSLTPTAVSAIGKLIDDKSTPERLRVRALDAFRRDPCNQLKLKAFKVFENVKEPSHIRIQAYLTLSRCLKQDDVDKVQRILNSEESSQVGSFVATHIENMVETATPSREETKQVFNQFTIPTGLRKDMRKFSRNTEYSTFFSNLNFGGSFDSNLIFSQDSYIPRMASTNLTLDAFGRSYNFLEIGVYAEDFEHLVEKYFGPSGKLRKAIDQGADKISSIVKGVRNRFKRELRTDVSQNELEAIREKVQMEERTGDNGVGDIYVRIMGTSILIESFSESDLLDGTLSTKIMSGVTKIMEGAKDTKFDLTHPILFLDQEFIVPTFSGFPLNLDLEGTSILSLQMNGNFDLTKLLRGHDSDMKAKIIPSAATLLKSRMTVGTGPIESGLQLEGKIHSSAGVDIKLVKEDGKLEFRFNLPQDRAQIVDLRSDLYWIEQPWNEQEKKTHVQNKLETKSIIDNSCMTTFSKMTGLKLCADMKIPSVSVSAPFPILNGPGVFSLSIEKSEPSMEGYYLKAERKKESDNFELDFLFDTPGSRTNRRVTAALKGLKYGSSTPEYVFKLDSPFNKMDVNYKRSFTDELKGVEIKVVSDGDKFEGKMQLKRVQSGSVNKYEPIVQFTIPGGRPVKLIDGHVTVQGQGKVEMDLKAAGPLRALRASVKGAVEVPDKPTGFEVKANNLELSSDLVGKMEVNGHLTKAQHMLDTKLHVKYGQQKQHSFEFESKGGRPESNKYEITTRARSSQLELFNVDIHAEVVKDGQTYRSELTCSHGLSEPVEFSHKLRTTFESSKSFEIFQESVLKHPSLHLDVYSKIDAKAAPGQRNADFVFNINSFKSKAEYKGSGDQAYNVKATAEYSGKIYEFSEVATKTGDNKHNFNTKLSVTPGFWYMADTDTVIKTDADDFETSLSSTITSDKLNDPVVLKAGVRQKPEGYNALVKLDMKAKTFLDLETQYKRPKAGKPASFNTKALVLNYLDAKLVHTFSRSESNMQLDLKWIPGERKIEAKSKLLLQGEVLNVDANLKWDAERDQTKSLSVKSITSISFSRLQIDSKNDITLIGKLAKVNLKGQMMKEFLNGEDNLELDYTSPNGKRYNFLTSLNLENKLKTKAGKLNVKVTLPDQKPYDFSWDNRVTNIDPREATFDATSSLKIDYKGEKDARVKLELSSLLPGAYRSYNGKIDVSGSIVQEPISGNIRADLQSGKFAVKGGLSKGSRTGDLDVKIDYDTWSPKKILDIQYKINTPFEDFKAFEGLHKHSLLYNSLTSFDYLEEGKVTLNHGTPMEWKFVSTLINKELKFLNSFNQGGDKVFEIKANGRYSGIKLSSEITTFFQGEEAFLNINADYELPKTVGFHILGGGKLPNFEVKTTHKTMTDGVYETDILAKNNNQLILRLSSKAEYTQRKKSIDFTVSTSTDPTRRLYLSFDKESSSKYNVEAGLRWGDGGSFLNTKGDLTKDGDNFDATMIIDSPTFKADKMNMKVSKKSQNGRHALTINIKDNTKDKFNALFDYGSSIERSGVQKVYEGSMTMKGERGFIPVDVSGKFKVEDSQLSRERDGEEGRQFRGSFEVSPSTKGNAVLKASDKEKRLQVSLCNEGKGKCRSGDIHFTHQHEPNGDLEYSLRILHEIQSSGKNSVTGVSLRTSKSEDGRQFDHTLKLIMSKEESEQLGYRLYRKDSHEIGAELLLPERTMAWVADCKDVSQDGDMKAEFTFWIDKLRKPDKKVILTINSENHKGRTGMGRDLEIVFKHPDLDKDMRVYTTVSFPSDNKNLWDAKTVLDLFKEGSEVVVTYNGLRDGHRLWKTQWTVVSKGMNLDFGSKSEVSFISGFHYKQDLHFMNKERQKKTAKIEAMITSKRMGLEVLGHSTKLLTLMTTLDSLDTGYQYKQEFYYPGMDNSRIFQTDLQTSSPRKVAWKTFSSDNPAIYYEAILGFPTHDRFVAGVYDQDANERKTLADVTVGLNSNNRILNVKSTWERENIKNIWTRVQSLASRNSRNLKDRSQSTLHEVMEEAKFVLSNVIKSMPSLKAVIVNAKSEMNILGTELDAHPETKVFVDHFKGVILIVKKAGRSIIEMIRVIRRFADFAYNYFRERFEEVGEYMEQYSDKVPFSMDDLKSWADKWTDCMSDFVKKATKFIDDTITRVSNSMPEIIDAINWALDLGAEFAKGMQTLLDSALSVMVKWSKTLRSLVNHILDNEMIRILAKDVIQSIQIMITEFIDETKQYAETFKDYLLKFVPEKDLQELIELMTTYVQKKAENQRVDDFAEIKKIYDKLEHIVKKLVAKVFSINVEEGFLSASVPLPTPIQSLTDIGQIFDKLAFPYPPRVRFNIPSYRFGLRELFNKVRHGAGLNEFLPPYDGFGLVIGSQYYKTFDGQIFHFDGSCQYLLASDFEDSNFTVVVDYDRKDGLTDRALTVKDHHTTISIKSDNTVIINGKTYSPSDLEHGHTSHHFKVEHTHGWIVVTGERGIKLGCSTNFDVCAVKVNGFYHGKVLGLLGKFNQEKYDDMTTSDGKIADTVNDFAESWKLNKPCREQVVVTLPVINSQASQKCSDAFESRSSTLRPCYGVIQPSEYQRMCENLSSKPGYDAQKAVCTSSTAYAKACRLSYASVQVGDDCKTL